MTNHNIHILLVENNKHVRKATALLLSQAGYVVFVSGSIKEAKQILANKRIHLALIDVRLEDDNNPTDRSGILLAESIDSNIAIILITAFPDWDTQAKVPTKYIYISKQASPQSMLSAVERLLREKVRINSKLIVDTDRGLSLNQFTKGLKDFHVISENGNSEAEATAELKELFQRLFLEEDRIKLYYLVPGHGGSGVAKVRPYYGEIAGEMVVVKFGQRSKIVEEERNYREFVARFIPRRSTRIIGEVAETKNLAGIKFMFVGQSGDQLNNFDTYFANSSNSSDAIRQVIKNIFTDSCQLWYRRKRDWAEEGKSLISEYKKQLSLEAEADWLELNEYLQGILDDQVLRQVAFAPVSASKIQMRSGTDDKVEALWNPLYVVETHPGWFPKPAFSSITHGDLNSHNIFIDEDEKVWLIDFFKTGWGPALRDAAELETVLKFQMLETMNLPALLRFEARLLEPNKFSTPIPINNEFHLFEFERVRQAIQEVRQQAMNIAETDRMLEYYANLLFYALKMITWQGLSSGDRGRYEVRQRHALYSAALICEKLAEAARGVDESNNGHASPISTPLYQQLKQLLLSCATPLNSNDSLQALFIDARIHSWQHHLPNANSVVEKVEQVISFLHNKWRQPNQNGLVLFLHVLRDRLDTDDECWQQLGELAQRLERELSEGGSGLI